MCQISRENSGTTPGGMNTISFQQVRSAPKTRPIVYKTYVVLRYINHIDIPTPPHSFSFSPPCHASIHSIESKWPTGRGVAPVGDVGVLTPTLFPVRGFNTRTFSAVFPQFCTNALQQSLLRFSGRSVCARCGCLLSPPSQT